jgi:tRNA threonylcarbamoyladenosine biosynthesis protein TsaE
MTTDSAGAGGANRIAARAGSGYKRRMIEPAIREATRAFDLPDLRATEALAGRVAALATVGDIIALAGPLGAGKTAFARAFITALAGTPTEVPSPTFTLLQTYATPRASIWHFDLYRLERAEEAYELGVEEAFADGISLIEWPERLAALLPDERLTVNLSDAAEAGARSALLTGRGTWAMRLARL